MAEESRNEVRESRFTGIGMLPDQCGALVMPEADDAAHESLKHGDWHALPEEWAFLREAWLTGSCDASSEPLNRAVMTEDTQALQAYTSDGDVNVRTLARSVAARLGADISVGEATTALDPRVAAYARATVALRDAERGEHEQAREGMRAAAELVWDISPCAAARYIGESCTVAPADHRSLLELERAAKHLETLGFETLRGELLMTAADIALALGGERPAMLQHAVQLLQRATQALPRRTHPVAFAVCQMNVGVAYLSMPMNEHAGKLRGAIGVQALREALEILTPDSQPELWESATLNLANALQHLPSSHPGENLVEAVTLYEALLERRTTPTAERGRVLANLGNAFAHLAQFADARERLAEAQWVFESLADQDAVGSIRGVLEEIAACEERVQNSQPGNATGATFDE